MRSRIGFIIRYYINLVLIFIIEKPLFMLFTGGGGHLRFGDYLSVALHGIPMDMSVAGYLTIFPLLIVLLGTWWPLKPNLNARKVLRVYHIVIALIMAATFIVDLSLYPFWQYKLDSTALMYLANPGQVAANVSTWFIIIRVLAILVVARLIYKRLRYLTPNTFNPGEVPPGRRIICSVVIIFLCGLDFLAIRGGVKESTMNVGRVYYCNDNYLNCSAVNPLFSLFSTIGKNKDLSSKYQFMEWSEAERIVKSIYPFSDESPMGSNTESLAGSKITTDSLDNKQITQPTCSEQRCVESLLNSHRPNILIIQMESFGSTFTVDAYPTHTDTPVTPEFWKAAGEGVLFDNMYCNSYRTDRGVVSTFSGVPSLPTFSIMKQPGIVRNLPGIASALAKEGYECDFLYGGDINFTNTKGYLLSTGFTQIVSDVDFSSSQRNSNAWGVNDEFTFEYLAERIERLCNNASCRTDDNKPWFTGFLTLSSHEPFTVPFDKFDDKVYNSAAYTDWWLGYFINRIKQSKAWENLLIILIPDHNMLYNTTYADPNYFRCQMVWIGGAVKEREKRIGVVMNQSDLAATLLSQLGLSHSEFPFSRNVFAPNYSQVAFSSYNGGFLVADTTGATNYDLASQRILTYGAGDNARRVMEGKAILQTLANSLAEYMLEP